MLLILDNSETLLANLEATASEIKNKAGTLGQFIRRLVGGKGSLLVTIGWLLQIFGELDQAMALYLEVLRFAEHLPDLQIKGATLHGTAYIRQLRGELDRAMELYQEALYIEERLPDLQGKGATLAMHGQLLAEAGKKELALKDFVEAIVTLANISPRDAKQVVERIRELRGHVGDQEFNALWRQATGQPEPPERLAEPRKTKIDRVLALAGRHEEGKDWQAAVETHGEAHSLLDSRTLSDEEQRRYAETVLRLGICLRLDGNWGPKECSQPILPSAPLETHHRGIRGAR
jgi:tetratricopeptide (TPR) repeat protein